MPAVASGVGHLGDGVKLIDIRDQILLLRAELESAIKEVNEMRRGR